ncbi:Serine/threonine-protein kinase-like protein CCR4 [Acorus calamus]|uniref:Serine/threonine-protein kinase-like protein CCR4 n=1 Tax=Acorus calamus TaxID=4465 RepID=A0AAV9ECE9_ACOCL|nr:Serine/threonine-protein kinase-like protein CCR4 [Acorus calamus]
MMFPFFNAIVGLLGSVAFWPLTVYLPVSMYMAQAKIKRGSHKWLVLHGLSVVSLIVSLIAAVGSFADIADRLKHATLFKIEFSLFGPLSTFSISHVANSSVVICALLPTSGQAPGPVLNCTALDSRLTRTYPNQGMPYSSIAAGDDQVCGLDMGSRTVVCWWWLEAARGPAKGSKLSALAVGRDFLCGLMENGTVTCAGLWAGITARFASIGGRGRVFCGVMTADFSLACWGRHDDTADEAVFVRVLPGPCRPASDCACGMLSDSGSVCGDNGVVCLLCKLARPAHASPKGNQAGLRMRLALIIVGTVGVVSCLLGALLAFVLLGPRKENKQRVHDSGRHGGPWLENVLIMGHGGKLEEFELEELSGATDGFSEAYRIGTGSFGGVYRAVLSDGRAVALKWAEPARPTSISHRGPGRERDDFVSELALLSRLNHKNLVRLFGHCSDGVERVLVYEYVANGSLHDHLFHGRAGPLDSCAARVRVALDAARRVEYLHAYAVPPVVHCDIKSSNILLGLDLAAKVADFGLSRFAGGADANARAVGTVGYMDPEYYRMRRLTTKSDVYSFGVVLLEMLNGIRARHWDEEACAQRNIVDLQAEGGDARQLLDKRLPPPTPAEIEAVERVWEVAASCVRLESHDRPTMTDVVAGLECALAVRLEPECLSRSTIEDRSSI